MPWHVSKSSKCPTSKPWAVIKDSDGTVMGCHLSEDDAMEQMKALHANESNQSPMEREVRNFHITELRAKRGDGLSIAGHAAVFNELSDDLGGFREKILPGTFKQTIEQDDIRALWNHDPNYVLARNKSGTLRITEDKTGLAIEADLVDEPFERSLIKKIERGDVSQMSFGFRVPPKGDTWEFHEGALVRTLNTVQLFDVSPVTFPAYPQTDVGLRTLAAEMRKKFESAELTVRLTDARIGRIQTEDVPDEAFLYRLKIRNDFLERRKPVENPLSLAAIIRSAKLKSI